MWNSTVIIVWRHHNKLAWPWCLQTQPEPSADSFGSAESGLRNTGVEEQKGLAYHLEGLRVPQFGNHWSRWNLEMFSTVLAKSATAYSIFWIIANFADGQQLVHFSFDGANVTTNPLVNPGSNSSAYGELQVHVFNMHCCCSWKFVLQSLWNDKKSWKWLGFSKALPSNLMKVLRKYWWCTRFFKGLV